MKKYNKYCALSLTLILIGWVVIQIFVCEPVIRESDQASILHGSHEISKGNLTQLSEFYNFDKQFVSYGIIAASLSLFSKCDVVYVGNLASLLVLIAAIFILFLKSEKTNPKVAILWICALFSPVMLLSAPFLSTNILSIAFIISMIVLLRYYRENLLYRVLLFILGVFAVGCRADAVLIFPYIIWLTMQDRCSIKALVKSEIVWILILAAASVLITGKVLQPSNPETTYPLFINPLAWVCFILFSASPLMICLIDVFRHMMRDGRLSIESKILGILSLILPLLYYIPVLCSPRHLILNVVILLATSHLYRHYLEDSRAKWSSRIGAFSVISCIGLLFLGIKINEEGKFRLTVFDSGESFPTADGFWPMGGTWSFLMKLKEGKESPVDHNMQIWNSITNIEGGYHQYGAVNLLRSQMQSYHLLNSSILGVETKTKDALEDGDVNKAHYLTSRSLLKKMPHIDYPKLEERLNILIKEERVRCLNLNSSYRLYYISATSMEGVLSEDIKQLLIDWTLGEVFKRNDFQMMSLDKINDLEIRKHQYILLSSKRIETEQDSGLMNLGSKRGWFIYEVTGELNNFNKKESLLYRSALPRMMMFK